MINSFVTDGPLGACLYSIFLPIGVEKVAINMAYKTFET